MLTRLGFCIFRKDKLALKGAMTVAVLKDGKLTKIPQDLCDALLGK